MIPTHLECDYCKKNIHHGGSCYHNKSGHCLAFEQDQRGKIVYEKDVEMEFEINSDFPEIGKWQDDYVIDEDIPIKFMIITPLNWIVGRRIAVKFNVSYYCYDNSIYCEGSEDKRLAPVLQLVKGGEGHERTRTD